MALVCRSCDSPIEDDRTNQEAGLACCGKCGALWPVVAAPRRAKGLEMFGAVPETGACRLAVEGNRLDLTYPMRTRAPWGYVLGLALTGGGGYWLITLLRSLLLDRGDVRSLDFWLEHAGELPFLAIALVVVAVGLLFLVGRGRLTIEPPTARLWHGVGPLGWSRRTTLDATSRCECGVPSGMGIDTAQGGLRFGWFLPSEERHSMADRVNGFLDATTAGRGEMIIPRSEEARFPACARCNQVVGPASVNVKDLAIDCPFCHERSALSLDHSRPESELVAQKDRSKPVPKPTGTRIVIEYPADGRMVIFLPRHGLRGNSLGMFIFSCVWNGFMVFWTWGWYSQSKRFDLFPGVMVIAFFAIGLGMLYGALRGALSKTLLDIERERLFLRRVFLGRTRDKQAVRQKGERVQLAEAYKQNEQPIYKLAFAPSKLNFGTELDQPEKEWLVSEIGRFMDGLDAPAAGSVR